MDPRTLQQAAALLAKYTSEEEPTEMPANEYADLWRETGLDNAGGMGQEPACDLYSFSCRPSHHKQQQQQPPGASHPAPGIADPSATEHQETATATDGATVVGCDTQTATQTTHSANQGHPPLSEISDTVPSATAVSVTARGHIRTDVRQCHPHKVVALRHEQSHKVTVGLSDDVDCAVIEAAVQPGTGQLDVNHVATVPALAYVAAGMI